MLLDDRPREPGLLAKMVALLGGAALVVLGFMFSLVLIAVAVVLVAGVWAYLWWKTRELRRRLREAQAAAPAEAPRGGQVFDGESARVGADDGTEGDRRA